MSGSFFSQASNFISALNTQVDPRTGQFMVNLPLVRLVGNNQLGPELSLNLSYSPLNLNNYGFGTGFSLGTTQFNNKTNLLELSNGEKYKVAPGTDTVRNQKLATFRFVFTNGNDDKDGYTIFWKEGKSEQLSIMANDETFVITAITSPLGRRLELEWEWSGQFPRLLRVSDQYTTLCELTYGTYPIMTVWPDTDEEYQISFELINDDWLDLISFQPSDSDRLEWSFEYEKVDGSQNLLLTTVKYPTGMQEKVEYSQIKGLSFPEGSGMGNLPAVLSHTRIHGGNQPKIQIYYEYTQQNFLGYNGNFGDWSEDSDYIYNTLTDYVFGSTETVTTGDTTVVTEREYNNYHLQISEVITRQNATYRTDFAYYAQEGDFIEAQPPQFQLIKEKRESWTDEKGKSFTQSTLTEFDESGNPVREVTPVVDGEKEGTVTVTEWYKADGEDGCPAEPEGFVRFIKKQTVTPMKMDYDAPQSQTRYTYRKLGNTNSVVLESRSDYADGVLLQKQTMTYDDEDGDEFGRMTAMIDEKCEDGDSSSPYITQQDFTTKIKDGIMSQTVTFTGHDSIQSTTSRSQSVFSGRVFSQTNAQNVTVNYTYDKLGRLQTQTNAADTEYENVMSWNYDIGADGPVTTQTDAAGNKVKTFFDGTGRSVLQQNYDADISRQWYDISTSNYNALGEFSHGTGNDWMTSSSLAANNASIQSATQYDSWGEIERLSFSDGLEQFSTKDPVAHTSTEYSAGKNNSGYLESGRTFTAFDVRSSLPLRVNQIDVDGNEHGVRQYSWDGLGRLRKEIDELGHEITRTYDVYGRLLTQTHADGSFVEQTYAPHLTGEQIASISLTGMDADGTTQTWILGTQTFDSLGRLTKRTSGGRTTSYVYNSASPLPARVTLPSGKTIQYSYIPELGNAISSMTADGVTQTFQYNPLTGDLLQASEDETKNTNSWAASGKLKGETFIHNGATRDTRYNWTLNGEPMAYTDITGSQTVYERDSHGKITRIIDDVLTVDLEYDALGRMTMRTVKDASTASTLRTALVYDDFGREITRTLFDSNGTTLVVTQEWLKNNLLDSRTTKQDGNLLRQESYEYDKRNRLINYKVSGSDLPADGYGYPMQAQQYTYDALNNLVSVTTTLADGTSDTTEFSYENDEDPTQLTGITHSHESYPPVITLEYDSEGRMIRDEAGRELTYDVMGRLIDVRGDGIAGGSYSYDALNRLVSQNVSGGATHALYYRAEELVNEVTT